RSEISKASGEGLTAIGNTALDNCGGGGFLHSHIGVGEDGREVLQELGILEVGENSAGVPHHVPAIVGQPFARNVDCHASSASDQARQRHAAAGGRFFFQEFEQSFNARRTGPAQHRGNCSGRGGVAAILQIFFCELCHGGRRHQFV